ncbi:MAG: DUF4259 domain-containing protein, partial [Planctomycetota bacterium]
MTPKRASGKVRAHSRREITMGARGEDSFDNDTACDWIMELESGGLNAIESAIDSVIEAGEGVDADLACEAIAACDVVARLQGRFGQQDAYTESLDEWVRSNPLEVSLSLLQRATAAIDLITSESSELRELWAEDPDW